MYRKWLIPLSVNMTGELTGQSDELRKRGLVIDSANIFGLFSGFGPFVVVRLIANEALPVR